MSRLLPALGGSDKMYFVFIYVSKSDLSMLMIYLSMSKKDFFFFLQFDGTDSDQKKGTKRELGFSGKTKTQMVMN